MVNLVPLTFRQKVKTGVLMLQHGGKRDDFRELYSRAFADRLYYILFLDFHYPNLKIAERLISDESEPDHIRFTAISTSMVSGFVRALMLTGDSPGVESQIARIFRKP